MLVLLACAIEDSTDIFRISGGFEHPKPPLGTPLPVPSFRVSAWTAEM